MPAKKQDKHDVRFEFIRNPPEKFADLPPLASSMQSLESSFFLTAMHRYPHALVLAMTAIEGALRAYLRLPVWDSDRVGIHALLDGVGHRVHAIRIASHKLGLDGCVSLRNEIIHYGYSPKHDNTAINCYLGTAIPFLGVCYENLFNRTLNDMIIKDLGEYLTLGRSVMEKAKEAEYQGNMDYCLRPFAVRLRLMLKPAGVAGGNGMEQELFEAGREVLTKVRATFQLPWPDDGGAGFLLCPVCEDGEALADLDFDAYARTNRIRFSQMICPRCGFVARSSEPHLAEVVLAKKVRDDRKSIEEFLKGCL